MDFFIRYRGQLRNNSPEDKHLLRHSLSPQLRDLWNCLPQLDPFRPSIFQQAVITNGRVEFDQGRVKVPYTDVNYDSTHYYYAAPFKGWHFIPLLIRSLYLCCHVDIRFLRREEPGDIVHGGDLDNRLKTVYDALRIPLNESEVYKAKEVNEEEQCFCLLEDDSLITKTSVETGRLLGPLQGGEQRNDVDLSIHVTVRVTRPTMDNLGFSA